MMLLFGAETVDAVTALTNVGIGGFIGGSPLLAAMAFMLKWFMKRMEEKDNDLKQIMEDFRAATEARDKEFTTALEKSISKVVEHCESENEKVYQRLLDKHGGGNQPKGGRNA